MKATIVCQMHVREIEAKTLKGLKRLAVKTVCHPYFACSPDTIFMILEDGISWENVYNGRKHTGWKKLA